MRERICSQAGRSGSAWVRRATIYDVFDRPFQESRVRLNEAEQAPNLNSVCKGVPELLRVASIAERGVRGTGYTTVGNFSGAAILMDLGVAVGVVMYYRRLGPHVRVSYAEVFVVPVIATAVGAAVLGFGSGWLTGSSLMGSLALRTGVFTIVYLATLNLMEGRRGFLQLRYLWTLARA